MLASHQYRGGTPETSGIEQQIVWRLPMNHFVKDSGLNNLKATIQFCGECAKPQVHYSATNGCAICHACGYSPALEQLIEEDLPIAVSQPRLRIVHRAA
jgi:hypothetical protein